MIPNPRELLELEHRLQQAVVDRLLGPFDAILDMLADSGAAMRQQAEAIEQAGRALEQTATLMKHQAELFERTIATLRQPGELARLVAGAPRKAGPEA